MLIMMIIKRDQPQRVQRYRKKRWLQKFNCWTSGWRALRMTDILWKTPLIIIKKNQQQFDSVSWLDPSSHILYVPQRKVKKSSVGIISGKLKLTLNKARYKVSYSTLISFHLQSTVAKLKSDREWTTRAGIGENGIF